MERAARIAMVPARIGSTRLPMKNLALVAGRPLISYAIRAALESGVFDRVVVNADHPVFAEVAERYGAGFYLRPPELGSSSTKSDDVVADFMEKHPAGITAWVNPTSPLQTADEVRRVVEHFEAEGLDTLITTNSYQVHAAFQGRPLNYREDGLFAQTQDLEPVELFVYSVMMWRNDTFTAAYRERGYALFSGRCGLFPVSRTAGIIIKREEDLMLADYILRAREAGGFRLEYDPLAEKAREESNATA